MSIPLPALGVNPPQQQPGALDNYSRLLQLQNLRAQQQSIPTQQAIQQEQLAQEKLQTQNAQQDVKDRQALGDAYRKFDPSKPDDLPRLISEAGGSGKVVGPAINQLFELKQKAATAYKDQQQGNSAAFDAMTKQADLFASHVDALKKMPDDQLPGAILPTVQTAIQQGLVPQEQAQQLLSQAQQIAQMPGDKIRPALDILEKQAQGQKAILDQTAKAAEIRKNTAEAVNAEQGANSAVADSRYRNILMKQTQRQPISAEDAAFKAAYEKQKTLVPTATFNLQNALPGGAGGQPSSIAKGLADGSIKWQDVVSPRTPISVKQQLLSEVKAIKPDFNSGDFAIEQDVKKEFTSGDAAKNLTAFNTAIEHANQLKSAADALDNGDVRALNKIGNTLGYQFGSDKTTNFGVIKSALSGEISKVFKGGQATDAEIRDVQAPFDAANSPAQLKGAIDNAIRLMNSKRDALKQQYQSGVQGKPNFGGSQPSAPQGRPVYVGGKIIGYTTDGKTMTPAQQ